ncbi:hypothetical protein AB1Y20_019264 [Prymnesium parvum]|uniref:Uncharacterized protein n=1 Tax=Prymnesium parvum TaxID=97485 RepID=A0AB34JTW1_PRYPA
MSPSLLAALEHTIRQYQALRDAIAPAVQQLTRRADFEALHELQRVLMDASDQLQLPSELFDEGDRQDATIIHEQYQTCREKLAIYVQWLWMWLQQSQPTAGHDLAKLTATPNAEVLERTQDVLHDVELSMVFLHRQRMALVQHDEDLSAIELRLAPSANGTEGRRDMMIEPVSHIAEPSAKNRRAKADAKDSLPRRDVHALHEWSDAERAADLSLEHWERSALEHQKVAEEMQLLCTRFEAAAREMRSSDANDDASPELSNAVLLQRRLAILQAEQRRRSAETNTCAPHQLGGGRRSMNPRTISREQEPKSNVLTQPVLRTSVERAHQSTGSNAPTRQQLRTSSTPRASR